MVGDKIDYSSGFNSASVKKRTFDEHIEDNNTSSGEKVAKSFLEVLGNKKPAVLFDELSKYVIGQDRAKLALCVAAANHYKRTFISSQNKEHKNDPKWNRIILKKANVLLIGPTGSGKTHMVTSLAEILGVPYASVSATSITAAGFVGNDVESVLRDLIFNAAGISGSAEYQERKALQLREDAKTLREVTEKAENGIIFIDEVDKIRKRAANNTSGRDIGGESVQQALLTMIEGGIVNVNLSGANGMPKYVSIDTSNILFVCGGAFVGIADMVRDRLDKEIDDEGELMRHIKDEDLEKFGFIPEFIGRLPVVATLDKLTESDFVNIITEPKDSLQSQYSALFAIDDAVLEFSKDALHWIAREALAKDRGARGLRTVMENLLMPAMYVTPSVKEYKAHVVLALFGGSSPKVRIEVGTDNVEKVKQIISKLPGSDSFGIDVGGYIAKDFI